jgi:hypothetical protein
MCFVDPVFFSFSAALHRRDHFIRIRQVLRALAVGWIMSGLIPLAAAEPQPAGEFGRASLHVTFPQGQIGRREPLVVTGRGQDVLYVWYSGENEIRVGHHHLGAGGPVSPPINIVPGRAYALELNLGAFYPSDPTHAAYAGRSEAQARLLQQQLVVLLDDNIVLNRTADFHPTQPQDVHFGQNPGPYVAPGRFSGSIESIRRHGIAPPMNLLKSNGSGPLRLRVRFPEFHGIRTEPLVSTGRSGAGDLFYVTYLAPGLIRFGHDSWNAGAVETTDVAYKPAAANTLELHMPAFSSPPAGQTVGRFILRFNDTVLMADDRPYHPSSPADLHFGYNGCESSAAHRDFSGEIEQVERMGSLTLSTEKFQLDPGPVRLVLQFPANAIPRTEPLLITGHGGAGDIIFVRYVDASHVVFGYDHWSKGGPLSEPIPLDYAATHTVEIQLGSLFPSEDDPAWLALPEAAKAAARDTVVIRLNGRTVLTHREKAYPSTAAEILTGLNSIGATTCERLFTGRIFHQERMGVRLLPP